MAKPPLNETREEKLARKKAAEEEAFLREVDDAVRQGDVEDFGRRYGKPLFAAVVLILAAFGGYLYWQGRQDAAREADAEVLVGALDQVQAGNLQTGADNLDTLAAEGEGAARANALMLQAGIAGQQGDAAKAAGLFGQIEEDGDAPQVLRDLARIRRVATQFDSMDKAAVVRELGPLASEDSQFFGSAGELVAMAQLQQGNRREAGALFARIAKDDGVPESIRSRARQMAGVLGVDAIVDAEKLLEEQGVDTDATPDGEGA